MRDSNTISGGVQRFLPRSTVYIQLTGAVFMLVALTLRSILWSTVSPFFRNLFEPLMFIGAVLELVGAYFVWRWMRTSRRPPASDRPFGSIN